MKKFAIILSGAGVYDGTEIHEATMLMLAIVQQKASYDCFAPDIAQHHVINHITGAEMAESRNVLVESARIARGKIEPLSALKVEDYDAIILPGGFGAAKNLDSYAFKGVKGETLAELKEVLSKAHTQKKPIGAMCIAPVIVAKLVPGAKLTVGSSKEVGAHLREMGAKDVEAAHGDVVLDQHNLFFSTPAYMLDSNIEQVYQGAYNMVKSILARL